MQKTIHATHDEASIFYDGEDYMKWGYPDDSKPHIQWNHADGPLLVCRDGTPHWLTMAERLWLRLGLTTLEQLDVKYNHEPQRGA